MQKIVRSSHYSLFPIRLPRLVWIAAGAAMLCSCNRIRGKGHELARQTQGKISEAKQQIRQTKDRIVDNTFPAYDDATPDTENNRRRFKEHLGIAPAGDVKHIYAFGDFLGADYKVLISFHCNQATVDAIVQAKHMTLTKEKDSGLLFSDEFSWWHKEKIAELLPFKAGKEYEYGQYLWYDSQSGTAYYEEFSL